MHLRTGDSSNKGLPTLIYKNTVFSAELAIISRVSTSMLAAERCPHARRINVCSVPRDLLVFAAPASDPS
jgi:hypothetical protein